MTPAEIGTAPLAAQLVEQRLSVVQVGGIEALGEPVVNLGEHRARLVAAAGITEQSREVRGSAQFACFRADVPLARSIRTKCETFGASEPAGHPDRIELRHRRVEERPGVLAITWRVPTDIHPRFVEIGDRE